MKKFVKHLSAKIRGIGYEVRNL